MPRGLPDSLLARRGLWYDAAVRRLALGLALTASGCGGAPAAVRSTVFDPAGARPTAQAIDLTIADLERPYPPLDGEGGWVGVAVLRGVVRFSRPHQWTLRDASLEPGYSFIRYVSPKAYSFAIYERKESPERAWRDIVSHYEDDVAAVGAKMVGQRVPVATSTNQGRAYTIDRKIDGKPPTVSHSREIFLRGATRVVLVQIVSDEDNLSRVSAELLEVLKHVEVL